MTFVFRQLFNLVYLLNSETGSRSIASGLAGGMILGFSPLLSLQSLLVGFLILFFRVQFGAALISMFFFKLISPLLAGLFHRVGDAVLGSELLEPLFVLLYNLPLVPYTRFYNTIVMGAGVVSILLVGPVYLVSLKLVDRYRASVLRRLKESRYWKFWKSTTLYRWYQKYESMMG